MSSVRPAYINVYQRILTNMPTNTQYSILLVCACVNPGKTVYCMAKCPNDDLRN